jgi:hypothetical protein
MEEYSWAFDRLANLCDLCLDMSVKEGALESDAMGEELVCRLGCCATRAHTHDDDSISKQLEGTK